MPPKAKPIPLMQGVKAICDRFKINEKQFYMFAKLGMPVRKINGRWYGHEENIDNFLKFITKGQPLEVPEEDFPASYYEE